MEKLIVRELTVSSIIRNSFLLKPQGKRKIDRRKLHGQRELEPEINNIEWTWKEPHDIAKVSRD